MKKLVATNIRLPEEDLIMYRQIALREKKSFSEYVRFLLKAYTHEVLIKGMGKVAKIDIAKEKNEEPIWSTKPFSSGIKDGARNHDRYLYFLARRPQALPGDEAQKTNSPKAKPRIPRALPVVVH